MKMKIEILSTQHIRPSSPTSSQLRDYKLSFIDERIPHSYIPLILYYDFDDQQKDVKLSEISCRLKNSLSDTLVQFYPLAGRTKDQISVDCNDEGILYVEAHVDGNISDVIKCPDSWILDELIPFKNKGFVSSAEELLGVQATIFKCGGMAVGICISHRIGDASTLSSFIESWASIASGIDPSHDAVSPVFNSATLFPPRNTPDFTPNLKSPLVQPAVVKLVVERLLFSSPATDALKTKVTKESCILRPTRVEVLLAFLWNRCMAAKGLDESGKSVAYHPVNLRGRISELTKYSFGNLFQMVSAESANETNWIRLVEKLRAAFEKIDSEYTSKLLGERGFELAKDNFAEASKYLGLGNVEVFRFSSYCRFTFHEADFGWGKPVWVSSASFRLKDSILLFDSVECRGGIEAWIAMADRDMKRLRQDLELLHFTSSFHSPLD